MDKTFAEALEELLEQYTVAEIYWPLQEAVKRCRAMETLFGYAEAREMLYQGKPKPIQPLTDEIQ